MSLKSMRTAATEELGRGRIASAVVCPYHAVVKIVLAGNHLVSRT
jgi:hypothetical protein